MAGAILGFPIFQNQNDECLKDDANFIPMGESMRMGIMISKTSPNTWPIGQLHDPFVALAEDGTS